MIVGANTKPPGADLVVNLELRLAYCAESGRLWRLGPDGRPGRELKTWYYNEPRDRFTAASVWLPGIGVRRASRVIWHLMSGDWLPSNLYVDHVSRDPRDNRWINLRLATPAQNRWNTDQSHLRWHGRDELLEAGVYKASNGNYGVSVCGTYYGTYRSRIEANEVARRIRSKVKGAFDVPFVSWRRHYGPSTRC